MKGKLALFLGFGCGYVLGSRAGVKRYEQIKRISSKVWNTPVVQSGAERAKDFAGDKASKLRVVLGRKVGEVIAAPRRRNGSKSAAAKPTQSSKSQGSSAKKSSAKKTTPKKSTAAKSSTKSSGAKKSSKKQSAE